MRIMRGIHAQPCILHMPALPAHAHPLPHGPSVSGARSVKNARQLTSSKQATCRLVTPAFDPPAALPSQLVCHVLGSGNQQSAPYGNSPTCLNPVPSHPSVSLSTCQARPQNLGMQGPAHGSRSTTKITCNTGSDSALWRSHDHRRARRRHCCLSRPTRVPPSPLNAPSHAPPLSVFHTMVHAHNSLLAPRHLFALTQSHLTPTPRPPRPPRPPPL